MKLVNTAKLAALPDDDKVYGVYWAGQALLGEPNGDHPRFYIWLKEVDGKGEFVSGARLKRVVQPAGFLPTFAIGSLWHKQKAYAIDDPKKQILTLNIKGQDRWCPVHVSDSGGNGHHNYSWISPLDYRLSLKEEGGRFTAGYKSWVVPMTTVDGKKVIVPCYELYRAFYAGSSALAWQLLTGPWSSVCQHFIKNEYGCFEAPGGGHRYCVIQPVSGIGSGVFPYLGMFSISNWARRCADGIYVNLLHDAQRNGGRVAWLKAVPPFFNSNFTMKVNARYLPSTDSYLITKIESASSPISDYSVMFLVSDNFSPDEEDGGEDAPHEEGEEDEAGGGTQANVKGSRGRYLRRPSYCMSIGDRFFIDSNVERVSYRSKPLPPGVKGVENKKNPLKQDDILIGVGGKSDDGTIKQGSFENTVPSSSISRMFEIHSLVSKLVENEKNSFMELDLVNSVEMDGNKFCGLGECAADFELKKWANIYSGDESRSRLAWVIQLKIDGKVLYWIEIEHARKSEKYCSLVFKTVNNITLDKPLLRDILKVCVNKRGAWPINPPGKLAKKIIWKKVRHISNGKGGLTDSTLLIPLKSMGVEAKF